MIHALIDVRDRRYAGRLAEYLNKYFSASIEAEVYDPLLIDPGSIEGTLILLTDEPDVRRDFTAHRTLILSEQLGINPYQPAGDIAAMVLEAGSEASRAESPVKDQPTTRGSLISIFGLHGGIGATTLMLSMGAAMTESLYDRTKVLGLTMDPSLPVFVGMFNGPTLGDLVYSFLAESRDAFRTRLREMPEPVMGKGRFRLLPPARIPDDLDHLSDRGMEGFLRELLDAYDHVIFDLGSRPMRAALAVMDLSDRIILLTDGSGDDAERRAKMFQGRPWSEKLITIRCEKDAPSGAKASFREKKRMTSSPEQIVLPYESGLWMIDDEGLEPYPTSTYHERVREILRQRL